MRQCQQERRIATQLMAIRKEKDTIRNNRIYRLQQYEEQRMREFNEAMDRERVSGALVPYLFYSQLLSLFLRPRSFVHHFQ